MRNIYFKDNNVSYLLIGLFSIILNACGDNFQEIGVETITVDKNELTVMVGDKGTIKATIFPHEASNKKINWSSSNTDVATVNVKGEVLGIKEGEAVISVTTDDGNKVASCSLTVTTKIYYVANLTLNTEAMHLYENETTELEATILPENTTNKKIIWTSDNEAVATVDEQGVVKALSEGEAVIIATTEDGGKSASCLINVTRFGKVTGVTLDQTELSLLPGEKKTLFATVLPEEALNKNVTWSSDNEAIAIVDENGTVTGISSGKATITVTTEDESKTAQCNVTVGAIFQDSFDRGNTDWGHKNTSPNPVAPNWRIVAGYAQISDQKMNVMSIPPGLPNMGDVLVLYEAQGAITKNTEGSFKFSIDYKLSEATTSWMGFIINAQDDQRYYLLRFRYGVTANPVVQFLATDNGGAAWSVIHSTGVSLKQADIDYHLEINSSQAGVFDVKITNKTDSSIFYQTKITDSQARFSNGRVGVWAQNLVLFDNLNLEVR